MTAEQKLNRCCILWGIGTVFYYLLLGVTIFWFDLRPSEIGLAVGLIFVLSMPLFIAFFGPWFLNRRNPHAWLS